MREKLPEGFSVPIFKSLSDPLLMAGAPRDFVIMNATLGFAFGMMLQVYPLVIINIVLHFLAVAATKRDPQFFQALKRHINEKKYYDV